MSAYDQLEQFLAGYFHQDWCIDYANPEDAVRDFLSDPTDQWRFVVLELDAFISEIEECQRRKLLDLGCYFDPTVEGESVVSWLRRIRAMIASSKGISHDHASGLDSAADSI